MPGLFISFRRAGKSSSKDLAGSGRYAPADTGLEVGMIAKAYCDKCGSFFSGPPSTRRLMYGKPGTELSSVDFVLCPGCVKELDNVLYDLLGPEAFPPVDR